MLWIKTKPFLVVPKQKGLFEYSQESISVCISTCICFLKLPGGHIMISKVIVGAAT